MFWNKENKIEEATNQARCDRLKRLAEKGVINSLAIHVYGYEYQYEVDGIRYSDPGAVAVLDQMLSAKEQLIKEEEDLCETNPAVKDAYEQYQAVLTLARK